MFYSCFNQKTGLYDYYQDSTSRPINGDLPIPQLPPSTGRIGVPSIEAGRPLPSGAKKVGQGWHARGLIVQCRANSLGTVEGSGFEWTWWKALGAGALVGIGFAYLGSQATMFKYGVPWTEKDKTRKKIFSSHALHDGLIGGSVGLLAFFAGKRA